jgi:hypothetical protein
VTTQRYTRITAANPQGDLILGDVELSEEVLYRLVVFVSDRDSNKRFKVGVIFDKKSDTPAAMEYLAEQIRKRAWIGELGVVPRLFEVWPLNEPSGADGE